jgi:hypothetical protein
MTMPPGHDSMARRNLSSANLLRPDVPHNLRHPDDCSAAGFDGTPAEGHVDSSTIPGLSDGVEVVDGFVVERLVDNEPMFVAAVRRNDDLDMPADSLSLQCIGSAVPPPDSMP